MIMSLVIGLPATLPVVPIITCVRVEASLGWYVIRTYVLGLIIPKFRSKSMRLERMALAGGGSLTASFNASNHMVSASAAPAVKKTAKKKPAAAKAKAKPKAKPKAKSKR